MPGRIINGLIQRREHESRSWCSTRSTSSAATTGATRPRALLEVLDAEQNDHFRDNYMEIPVDLSRRAVHDSRQTRTDTIPRPLLDRMEVIELSSYTDEEKLQIAKQHLLPKQRKKHGLKQAQLRVSDDAIREIVTLYTRESGVRVLERNLAAVCRKTAKRIALG